MNPCNNPQAFVDSLHPLIVVGYRGSIKQGMGAKPEKMGQASTENIVGYCGSNKQAVVAKT